MQAHPSDPIPHAAQLALREQAETRRHLLTQAVDPRTPAEVQRLVQELQVHQIELEMQNEELLLAQAEAEAARQQYVDLFDFAPVGYCVLSPLGLIEQLNLCASQQLGTVRQRLVGRRFALFVSPAQRLDFGQFLARVLAAEKSQSCELLLERHDRTPFYAALEGLRVETPAGPQCRLALTDISSRHRASEALAASEARFRQLFMHSADAVLLLQGPCYVDCNEAALRLLGLPGREHLVGHPAEAFAPEYQPDGQRTADLFRTTVAEALRTGSHRCEALLRRHSGEPIWVEAVLTSFEPEGTAPLVHIVWRDITATRAAARLLRDSEARLSLALRASQTGVFTWDFATDLVQADPTARAVLGQAAGAAPLPLATLEGAILRADQARAWGSLQAAIATQQPLELDFRVQWADGSVHHASLAGRATTNEQGHSTGFTGVLRDSTAQRAVQDELNYKSLVLERLLAHMPLVLSRLSPDGRYLESLGAGLRALGLAPGALVGRELREVFPAIRPEVLDVLAGGQVEFLTEVPTAGGPRAFQSYGFFDEQRQQAVMLSFDVSETMRQQHQLQAERDFTRSLLENSVDAIVSLDADGRVRLWNAEAARYFGQRAAEVVGKCLLAVVPHLPASTPADLARARAGQRTDYVSQTSAHRPGSFDVHYVPLQPAGQAQPNGVLILFRDVTERDRLAEEATQLRLRQQQAVLAAILDTQETERKRIAEALHNGLGQLLYATKLSLDGPEGVPLNPRDTLGLLQDAIRTTRTISFELTPGILEDFGLRTALETLVKRIAPARLPVHLHLAGLEQRLPAPVEIGVYRTVQELLNNVMKHAHASEVEVHVAHEQRRLFVSVEDNGCGFDPGQLASAPLAGIGLAGVRNRVALLGGELAIQAQPGRGTIVSFEVEV
ncbi:MAG: PAS domain S-box protein [Bacteroidota bacterium]|nr:PAS domain S-box protein [Bacteroidota bacterium]